MMSTNYYDVVLVGHELSVLMTGCLLARRGCRVLWLGEGGGHRHSSEILWNELALPTEPFFFTGFDRPTVQRVLQETTLAQTLKRRLIPCRPPFQVALPEARVDVGESDVLTREIDREFPDDRVSTQATLAAVGDLDGRLDALLELDATFPPQGFWERRNVARTGVDPRREEDPLAGLAEGHPLRQMFDGVAAAASALEMQHLIPAAKARLFTTWRRGTSLILGGREALGELFLQKVEAHSGDLQPNVSATQIVLRRGRVTGVLLSNKGEAVGCKTVIVGSPERALKLCEGQVIPKSLRLTLENLTLAYERYVLDLVLPSEAVPEGMAQVVIAKDASDRPPRPENVFLLTTNEPDGRGRVVLTTEALVAPHPAFSELRARVLERVGRLVPFVQENLLLGYSPHDGLPACGKLADSGPPPRQVPMQPVYRCVAPAWGLAALPYASGWKGLYMVSRASVPALGLEGEFTAAYGLARLLSAVDRKKDFLRRHAIWGS